MSGWRDTMLGAVITLQRGHDLTEPQRLPGRVPVIGSAGQNGWHGVARAAGPGVTVGRSGASAGVVTYVSEPYWPHNTCLYVTDFKGNDPKFIAYLLQTMPLAEMNSGAAQPSLNRNFLYPLPVRVPFPDEQRHIASILGAYDDLIEVNRRRVAVLEAMARGLFEEWFIRFRFPGHENHKIIDTPEGPLPEGWAWGSLGNLVEQRRDKTGPGEHLSERVYVPIECIGRRTLALSETRPWEEAQSSLQLFEPDDILFGAMRAYFHKVSPAPVAGITRSTCFVLRPRQRNYFSMATMALFRDETVAYAATHSKGSTIPYANWIGSLERFPVPLPIGELIERFDQSVGPMLRQIMASHSTVKLLASSRDLLLPRLISGELSFAAADRELEAAA